MTVDEIELAVESAGDNPVEFSLATGQRVVVLHQDSVFFRGRDVIVLHRDGSGSNRTGGFDVFDSGSVLRVSSVGSRSAPLDSPEPSPLLAPGVSILAWGESLLAVLACVVVCGRVGKIGYDYFVSIPKAMSAGDTWVIACWSALLAVEVVVLVSIVRFYRHRIYPLPLHYALGYRLPASTTLRGLLGVFWLGHGVLGVWAFSQIGHLGERVAGLWDWHIGIVIRLVDALFVWAGAHASMLFFLLAAKAFGASQDGLRRLWRWRMLIDFLIVMISLALSHQYLFEPQTPRQRYRR